MPRFHPRKFADFVQAQMLEKSVNFRDLVQRVGGAKTKATFNQLANGKTPDPSINTILVTADALRLPPLVVINAAMGEAGIREYDAREEELLFLWRQLPPQQRELVVRALDLLLSSMETAEPRTSAPSQSAAVAPINHEARELISVTPTKKARRK